MLLLQEIVGVFLLAGAATAQVVQNAAPDTASPPNVPSVEPLHLAPAPKSASAPDTSSHKALPVATVSASAYSPTGAVAITPSAKSTSVSLAKVPQPQFPSASQAASKSPPQASPPPPVPPSSSPTKSSTTTISVSGPGKGKPQIQPKLISEPMVSLVPTATDAPLDPTHICKKVTGDKGWPTYNTWKRYLPQVQEVSYIGRDAHPNYFLAARSVKDVEDAVKFAVRFNIRISVISSGYDYMGRNDAPNGLLVSVKHLKGARLLDHFQATQQGAEQVDFRDHLKDLPDSRIVHTMPMAISIGAGVSTQELNDALELSGLFTVGAAEGGITVAGGWSQGGGHGPLTSSYGLGVDQVLEYQVVTADGELKIANELTNHDLFWALRGGGGGTFGIVVQSTIKAYPSPRVTVVSWWLNTTESANDTAVYKAAAYLHAQFPALNSQGVQGFYYIYPTAIKGVFMLPGKSSFTARLLWTPLLSILKSMPGVGSVIQEYSTYPNFKEFFDATFGMLNETEYDVDEKCKRQYDWKPSLFECHFNITNQWGYHQRRGRVILPRQRRPPKEVLDPRPQGIAILDSQLLGASHLKDDGLAEAIRDAMPRASNGSFTTDSVVRGYLAAGGKVMKANATSIHPSWREAYTLLVSQNVTSIRNLSPTMGSYINEGYINATSWRSLFWGDNYPRLAIIKRKYDPHHLFFTTPGINADFWAPDASRLCPPEVLNPADLAALNASDTVPPSDNSNRAASRAYPSFATPWPALQTDADAQARQRRDKVSSLREVSARVKGLTMSRSEATGLGGRVTPLAASPKLPDWTPVVTGSGKPWDAFTAVPVETGRAEHSRAGR